LARSAPTGCGGMFICHFRFPFLRERHLQTNIPPQHNYFPLSCYIGYLSSMPKDKSQNNTFVKNEQLILAPFASFVNRFIV
jgi:hypothetical protein